MSSYIQSWSPSSLNFNSKAPIMTPSYSSTEPIRNKNWQAVKIHPNESSKYISHISKTRLIDPNMRYSDGQITGERNSSNWSSVNVPNMLTSNTDRTYLPRNSAYIDSTFMIPSLSSDSSGRWSSVNNNNLNDTIEQTEKKFLQSDLYNRTSLQDSYANTLSRNSRNTTSLMSGPI